MSNNIGPEDSVLRRHFQSTMELQRARALRQPPTDSVLRRHYNQLHASEPLRTRAVPQATSSAPPPRQPSPKPEPPPATRNEGGGLLGWLRRLFG